MRGLSRHHHNIRINKCRQAYQLSGFRLARLMASSDKGRVAAWFFAQAINASALSAVPLLCGNIVADR
jgi:hypothetical protein